MEAGAPSADSEAPNGRRVAARAARAVRVGVRGVRERAGRAQPDIQRAGHEHVVRPVPPRQHLRLLREVLGSLTFLTTF